MAADHDAPEREPGTTHAEHGAGDPQLVAVREPGGDLGERLVFSLRREETTVGSAEDQDIRLDGLRPAHFVILHDGRDEYRLRELAEVGGGSNAQAGDRILRTGANIAAGPWDFTFRRDEFADHGRPYGGRMGGEGSDNRTQPPRPADRAAGWPTIESETMDDG